MRFLTRFAPWTFRSALYVLFLDKDCQVWGGFSAFRNHFLRTPVFRRRSSTARSWRFIAGVRRMAFSLPPQTPQRSRKLLVLIILCSSNTGPLLKIVWLSILPFCRDFDLPFGTSHKNKKKKKNLRKNFHNPDRLKNSS